MHKLCSFTKLFRKTQKISARTARMHSQAFSTKTRLAPAALF
ncbi:MAG: hypothetical protein AVDCRST_MAG56-7359 [uncultured Cytophagales bacterium]|uniref:Uncharacterized protein n=1 Tax=uncultured Cytophagales bacterium TaxID=158755 RepID=A0A6J4LE93_9SPHI|nr:MAG: hypothetical protein AVDCRST_MAG56-7359 [uncultured Cytophagales bacterium]